MGKKKAVLVGVSYPGTEIALAGCATDVCLMCVTLIERFGFEAGNILLLLDTNSECLQPTGINIRLALEWLILEAQPGDVLLFHFSGHGIRLPLENGHDDNTGYDEGIVACDLNILIDDDFREIVDRIPEGVLITFISDSCHSGGLIENEKEQIGESTLENKMGRENISSIKGLLHRGKEKVKEKVKDKVKEKVLKYTQSLHKVNDDHFQHVQYNGKGIVRSRSLPVSTFVRLLREKTGNNGIDMGNLRQTLSDTYGDESSSKVKKFVKVILQSNSISKGGGSNYGGSVISIVGTLAEQFMKLKLDGSINKVSDPTTTSMVAEAKSSSRAILMSGCQSHETSADTTIKGDPDTSFGAFTNAINTILVQTEGPITNRDLILKVRKLLQSQGFTQHPGLYCSDRLVDNVFIC